MLAAVTAQRAATKAISSCLLLAALLGPLTALAQQPPRTLVWDARARELAVKEFDFSVETDNAALRQITAANQAALRKLVAEKARWKLDARASALGEAVTSALDKVWQGHLDVDGGLDQVHVENVAGDKDVLALDVALAGQLAIKFTP